MKYPPLRFTLPFLFLLLSPVTSGKTTSPVLDEVISSVCPLGLSDLVKKIITHESKSFYKGSAQPWPWTLNINGKGYYFNNKKSAEKAARLAIANGVSKLGVGFGQVEWRFHKSRFLNDISLALDPILNIQVTCAILEEGRKSDKVKNANDLVAYYHRPLLDDIAYAYADKVLNNE